MRAKDGTIICIKPLLILELNDSFFGMLHLCPYGKVGDVLWVRETFLECNNEYFYKASNMAIYLDDEKLNWKPSIHMPKTACRIFLEITNARVERLQDISGYDVLREGVGKPLPTARSMTQASIDYKSAEPQLKKEFQTLWQKINGPDSWEANPFVWVIEFKQTAKIENFI